MRRVQEFGLISDERIDDIIKDYILCHGRTNGEPFMSGYFHSIGCMWRDTELERQ